MKRLIVCAGIFLVLAGPADAQTGAAKKGKKSTAAARSGTSASAKKKTTQTVRTTKVKGTTLSSTGSYATRATAPRPAEQPQIADPLVRALDARAHGAPVRISNSGVVGMPKRAYGFANGQITFMPQGSRTTGSITGSGGVGTGTSPGVVSSAGPAMGLNGKNPYAGMGVYGNWGPGMIRPDTVNRPGILRRER